MADAKGISYDRNQEIRELLKGYDLKNRTKKTPVATNPITAMAHITGPPEKMSVIMAHRLSP